MKNKLNEWKQRISGWFSIFTKDRRQQTGNNRSRWCQRCTIILNQDHHDSNNLGDSIDTNETQSGSNVPGILEFLESLTDSRTGLIERTFRAGQERHLGNYRIKTIWGKEGIVGFQSKWDLKRHYAVSYQHWQLDHNDHLLHVVRDFEPHPSGWYFTFSDICCISNLFILHVENRSWNRYLSSTNFTEAFETRTGSSSILQNLQNCQTARCETLFLLWGLYQRLWPSLWNSGKMLWIE